MSSAYRRTGADPPFGDPWQPHGVAMEGWFWRLTERGGGAVVVALAGVNRAADGRAWGTVGLAAHPGGFSRAALIDRAAVARDGSTAIGEALHADRQSVRLDLGADAQLSVELEEPVRWPLRAFGGLGAAQSIPGLSQYWHPWLLHARVRGFAVAGGTRIDLDGAVAYAEKNWSNGGFPRTWWWGQAHGFDDDEDACVAFAGGRAGVGPLRMTATSLVVRAGGELVRLVRPLQPLHVGVDARGWRFAGRTPGGVSVEVEGHANGSAPHRLPIPLPAERRHREDAATQHLAGELRVSLRRRGRIVYEGTSQLAGLERGNGGSGPAQALSDLSG
ncbi:MAG: hypothetical protein JWQ20_3146 [Conexibacter sp.]|nr:hypothetical protein [Conexibacter sp.]